MDEKRAYVIDERRENQKAEELRFQEGVEIVAGTEEEQVLHSWISGKQPVAGQDCGKEERKLVGVEEHASAPAWSVYLCK